MSWYRWEGGDLLLDLRVQPRAGRDEIITGPSAPRLRVRAPAVDDRANVAAIAWLAAAFGVAKSRVALERGRRGRNKRFRIHGPTRLPGELGIERALPARTPP